MDFVKAEPDMIFTVEEPDISPRPYLRAELLSSNNEVKPPWLQRPLSGLTMLLHGRLRLSGPGLVLMQWVTIVSSGWVGVSCDLQL